ncbi:MAG: TolC family protein [Acidobacteria bacterium]|nr:TolC family protein [Acidobacteriota bacterium]
MRSKRPKFVRFLRAMAAASLLLVQLAAPVSAQSGDYVGQTRKLDTLAEAGQFLDQVGGKTVAELVALALEQNGELAALRKEAEAAEALIRQAGLRPNPSVEFRGTRQISGADNSQMIEGSIPIELYGRRGARIRVATREAEIRRSAVAERERLLAAEVRAKFGESLASALKLKFTAEMVNWATDNFDLIAATVNEGRRAPLEQNLEIVELNRFRAMFEMSKGKTEIALLELRGLVGLDPKEPLKLRGDFEDTLAELPTVDEATATALLSRPDLAGARQLEALAEAKIEQARAEARPEAEVMAGYQRMKSGFPLQGFDESGILRPIDSTFQFFTFGVKFTLPVRDRNQGMIAAATLERDAAARRREFGELVVKNEIATAFVQYRSATRAMEIYRVGVRNQASANLSVVRQTYELGSRTLFDVIAEQRRFVEIEGAYIDARLEAYLARVAIMKAASLPELTKK